MGFAVSSPFELNAGQKWAARIALSLAIAALAECAQLFAGPAAAQTPFPAQSTQPKPQDKLVIDADELVYDKDKNTISTACRF